MHTEMWEHPATQANVADAALARRPHRPPRLGRLTGAGHRPGSAAGAGGDLRRLPAPPRASNPRQCRVLAATRRKLGTAGLERESLEGRRVVGRAGGTREPLDPVRYLGNRSSGKQGWALAQVGRRPRRRRDPRRRQRVAPGPRRRAGRARRDHPRAAGRGDRRPPSDADVVVMAAALADFRPVTVATARSRSRATADGGRRAARLELVENPDIVRGLVQERAARGERSPHRRASPPRRATHTARSWTTPARSSPARAATSRSSTRSGATSPSARTRRRSTCLRRGTDEVLTRRPGVQGRRRRRALGHRRHRCSI